MLMLVAPVLGGSPPADIEVDVLRELHAEVWPTEALAIGSTAEAAAAAVCSEELGCSVTSLPRRKARKADQRLLGHLEGRRAWIVRPSGHDGMATASLWADGLAVDHLLFDGDALVASRALTRVREQERTTLVATQQACHEAAVPMLKATNLALTEHDPVLAKELLAALKRVHPAMAEEHRGVSNLEKVLAPYGTEVSELSIRTWLQGEGASIRDQALTVVVLWEAWCPHCKRELPRIQALYEDVGDRVGFIGLTRLTRGSSPGKARRFIREQGLTFPNAIPMADDQLTELLVEQGGVPNVALLQDGRVVYHGHPARLIHDEIVQQHLE
jgi:thiol-disulfide isomerase/thioredoxin